MSDRETRRSFAFLGASAMEPNTGDLYYQGFSWGGSDYRLGDFASRTLTDKQKTNATQQKFLALRITCIWTADSTGKTCLEGRQYVRPQDSPEGRKPYHGSAELLEGRLEEFELVPNNIGEKCYIEPLETFRKRQDFPEHVFFCRETLKGELITALKDSKSKRVLQMKKAFEAAEQIPSAPKCRSRLKHVRSPDDHEQDQDKTAQKNLLIDLFTEEDDSTQPKRTKTKGTDLNEKEAEDNKKKNEQTDKTSNVFEFESDQEQDGEKVSLLEIPEKTKKRLNGKRSPSLSPNFGDDEDEKEEVEEEQQQERVASERGKETDEDPLLSLNNDDTIIVGETPASSMGADSPVRQSSRIAKGSTKKGAVKKMVAEMHAAGSRGVTEENEEESEEDEEDDSIVEGAPISHSDERKRKRDRSWIEKAIEGKPSRSKKLQLMSPGDDSAHHRVPVTSTSRTPTKQHIVRLPQRKDTIEVDDDDDDDVIQKRDDDDDVLIVDPPPNDSPKKHITLKRKRDKSDSHSHHHHHKRRHKGVMGELCIKGINDNKPPSTTSATPSKKRRRTPLLQSRISTYMSPKKKKDASSTPTATTKSRSKIVVSESDSDVQGDSDFEEEKEHASPQEEIETSSSSEEDSKTLGGFIVEELSESEADKDVYFSSSEEEGGDNTLHSALADLQMLSKGVQYSFKVWLQYCISWALDSDFPSCLAEDKNEGYFVPARRKIINSLASRKNSLISSSAWVAAFKRDLDSLPQYRSWSHEGAVDCEACRRSNHPATYRVVLSGAHYDTEHFANGELTLEQAESGPNDETKYNLGRFCHERTEIYHRLQHFPLLLQIRVQEKVKALQDSGQKDKKIVAKLVDSVWAKMLFGEFDQLLKEADSYASDAKSL